MKHVTGDLPGGAFSLCDFTPGIRISCIFLAWPDSKNFSVLIDHDLNEVGFREKSLTQNTGMFYVENKGFIMRE